MIRTDRKIPSTSVINMLATLANAVGMVFYLTGSRAFKSIPLATPTDFDFFINGEESHVTDQLLEWGFKPINNYGGMSKNHSQVYRKTVETSSIGLSFQVNFDIHVLKDSAQFVAKRNAQSVILNGYGENFYKLDKQQRSEIWSKEIAEQLEKLDR